MSVSTIPSPFSSVALGKGLSFVGETHARGGASAAGRRAAAALTAVGVLALAGVDGRMVPAAVDLGAEVDRVDVGRVHCLVGGGEQQPVSLAQSRRKNPTWASCHRMNTWMMSRGKPTKV